VTSNVLHTTVVPIYWHPVVELFSSSKFVVIMWVDVTKEIPRRTSPLRHSISLTLCSAATLRTFAIYKAFYSSKWRLSICTRLKLLHYRKFKWKLLIWNCNIATCRTMYNWNRLTPVTLSVKCPVFHLELNTSLTAAFSFKLLNHSID